MGVVISGTSATKMDTIMGVATGRTGAWHKGATTVDGWDGKCGGGGWK